MHSTYSQSQPTPPTSGINQPGKLQQSFWYKGLSPRWQSDNFKIDNQVMQNRDTLIDQAERVFYEYDRDRSGYLDRKEFKVAVQALGYDQTKSKMVARMVEQDTNGRIGIDQFVNIFLYLKSGGEVKQTPEKKGLFDQKESKEQHHLPRQQPLQQQQQQPQVIRQQPLQQQQQQGIGQQQGGFWYKGQSPRWQPSNFSVDNQVMQNRDTLIDQAERVFYQYDSDRTGILEKDEFNKAVQALGYDKTKSKMITRMVDKDTNGSIGINEFVNVFLYLKSGGQVDVKEGDIDQQQDIRQPKQGVSQQPISGQQRGYGQQGFDQQQQPLQPGGVQQSNIPSSQQRQGSYQK